MPFHDKPLSPHCGPLLGAGYPPTHSLPSQLIGMSNIKDSHPLMITALCAMPPIEREYVCRDIHILRLMHISLS